MAIVWGVPNFRIFTVELRKWLSESDATQKYRVALFYQISKQKVKLC